ncbi:MAG: rRNA maturation RNase YbeY [Thermodesulfobacteriota bacterium]
MGYSEGELSILLTDDEEIARLNSRYRGKEGATNVLAFPMSESPPAGSDAGMLGDIVVSMDTARRESDAFKTALPETVFRLLIHGLLHLLGYDHEASEEEASRMEETEKRLLSLVDYGI